MQRTGKKDIFKTWIWILAGVNLFVIASCAAIVYLYQISAAPIGEIATEELSVLMPGDSEQKLEDEITIISTAAAATQSEATMSSSDYILPNSNTTLLTSADISGLSLQEINYAKNEIYARHGRRFKSQELQQYFSSKSWYNGIYEPNDFDRNYSANLLSNIEKKNAEFLKNAEFSMSSGGYKLDQ